MGKFSSANDRDIDFFAFLFFFTEELELRDSSMRESFSVMYRFMLRVFLPLPALKGRLIVSYIF